MPVIAQCHVRSKARGSEAMVESSKCGAPLHKWLNRSQNGSISVFTGNARYCCQNARGAAATLKYNG
jgi:hypothetical protein